MKKIIKYILILIGLILFLCYQVSASNKINGIENFPKSYQGYLKELAKSHPNWRFTALYTDLDWNTVIKEENVFGKSLVPKNYSDSWKNTKPNEYNVEIDRGWVDASKQALEYCMDPRNFLNEVRIFQFETLSYDEHTNSINGIEKILYGTEFYNKQVSYLDTNGNTIATQDKYSDLILRAGQTSLVSPYHLASRIKQEVGPFLSHSSISGTVEGFEGLYNFYNIGATSSAEKLGAIKNGLQYAKDGKGASNELKSKYLIPWNTKEKAITGGAIFIGQSYINVGQNTIYLQKFDVNDQRGGLFWHQYMTNILAPYSESKIIYNGYKKSEMLDTAMSFLIPVYENMPDIPAVSPDINQNDFIKDNSKIYCNEDNVNVRTGPNTSYETITVIPNKEVLTRIGKGNQAGGKWDKVILENGIIGYVYQKYVTEVPPEVKATQIIVDQKEIYLQIGDTFSVTGKIYPENVEDKTIIYESENSQVAVVDQSGKITALEEGETVILAVSKKYPEVRTQIKVIIVGEMSEEEINFTSPLKLNGFEISGLDVNKNTVNELKSKITTEFELEFFDNKGDLLTDTDIVGTGGKIVVKKDDRVLREYKIILYGDINGDGKINGIDLLVLQRHILEIEKIEGVYLKSANVRKSQAMPNSIDLFLIQRHILEIQFISQ